MSKFAFEMTKHPKIYINTYWGNFKSMGYIDTITNTRDVIANRNDFIEDFNIKSFGGCKTIYTFVDVMKRNYNRIFDHCEVYKTNDRKYVLIISPYYDSNKNDSLIEDFKEEFGFNEIYTLYSTRTITMIKIIDNLKELKKESNKF